MKDTQHQMIFDFLMTGAKLNPLEALEWFGVSKLSTRCGEIEKKYGITIEREWTKSEGKFGVKEFKRYFIKK